MCKQAATTEAAISSSDDGGQKGRIHRTDGGRRTVVASCSYESRITDSCGQWRALTETGGMDSVHSVLSTEYTQYRMDSVQNVLSTEYTLCRQIPE